MKCETPAVDRRNDFAGIHLVVEVVLAIDTNSAGFELHVDVFGDKDDGRGVMLHQQQASSEDTVINSLAVGENAMKLVENFRVFRAVCRVVDDESDGAPACGGDTLSDRCRAGEHLGEATVHAARVGTTLGLLRLEAIQFR